MLIMSLKKYQIGLNKGLHSLSLPIVSQGKAIPKVIYQTYKDWESLKPEWYENIDHICELNPQWKYHFFDDKAVEEFILQEYGKEILEVYLSISPELGPARADLFRYLLIYKRGGVYLDIKTTLTQPLDKVLQQDDVFILSHWYNQVHQPKELVRLNYQEDIQWTILSAAGHPFLRQVLNYVLGNLQVYNPWLHGVGKRAVLRITGPYAYTCAIEPIKYKYPHRFVNVTENLGIVYSMYELINCSPLDHPSQQHALDKNHYSHSRQLVVDKNNLSFWLYRFLKK
ncbi:hypothetical protein BGI32_09115 [Snodgrassella alvi]|uniref:Glycosyltransferase n=2 Tax=Snodgrassella alvi TaxID=1196083 RepID=A0A2N9WSB1_9NEIS|nr:hypothetical protein BGI32_09115 [Snodgrassella alvi]